MLCAIIAVALAQSKVGPVLPAGCDTRFQEACLRVETLLESGDFAAATAALSGLPKSDLKIEWNDSGVPADRKAGFAKARDRAIASWKKAVPELNVTIGSPGDVRISFAPDIEVTSTDLTKPGARHRLETDAGRRIVSVVSLVRGEPIAPVGDKDVQNEVGYAIGAYIGLAQSPIFSHVMGRTDQVNRLLTTILPDERASAQANLAAVKALKEACGAQTRLTPARSQIEIGETDPKETHVVQGAKPKYKFTVSNKGNVDLNYRIASTCACLVTDADRALAPGATRTIEAVLDTKEFTGELVKHLYFYSNDPARPVIELPVRSFITPRYRFLTEAPEVVLFEGPLQVTFYLTFPEGNPLTPTAVQVQGVEGTAEFKPWQGNLPDPELKEGVKPRVGYAVTVSVPEQSVFGRRAVAVSLSTDDRLFDVVQHSFLIQKGIVAMPVSVYLGAKPIGDTLQAEVVVTRPGKPFKVVSVTSDVPGLVGTAQPVQGGWEYKIALTLKASKAGPIKGLVQIQTDDKAQPVVAVAVRGEVR